MMTNIIIALVGGAILTLCAQRIIQVMQLGGYRIREFCVWLSSTKCSYVWRYFHLSWLSALSMLLFWTGFGDIAFVQYLGLGFYIMFGLVFCVITSREQTKTPLRLTARALRLIGVIFVLASALSLGLCLLDFGIWGYGWMGFAPMFSIPLVMLAVIVVCPIERAVANGFVKRAKAKLALNPDLCIVGITGSWGKTTAKNILATVLATKFDVCASPGSFNTPMGLVRTVNQHLNQQTQVLIAEMGARYRGDIAELCDIVPPKYGILTAVGCQHLETFGSLDVVMQTKLELLDGLTEGGVCMVNGDDPQLAERASGHPSVRMAGSGPECTVRFDDVSTSAGGTSFVLHYKDQSASVTTVLLGSFVPALCALCAGVALELGMTLAKIATALGTVQPIPHRLQLLTSGQTTIIDDAYNANLAGACAAIDILCQLQRPRVIVTPGIVELGALESEVNRQLGTLVARCDHALLIGSRAQFVRDGALGAGMSAEQIQCFGSLADAMPALAAFGASKSVLFENDLPDNLR